jgi:hypothetical protein
VFCREAPPEFNDHQRDVFCVFSNNGVTRLRDYLNSDPNNHPQYDTESTMYDDSAFDGAEEMIANLPTLPHQLTHMPPIPPYPQPVAGQANQVPPPPPPPPAPSMQQQPFPQAQGSSNRPDLPPLVIPTTNEGSPNAMSPTHDAPLTIDDEDVQFGDGSEDGDAQDDDLLPSHQPA